jgi:putative hydrolase of the HAD superfamily
MKRNQKLPPEKSCTVAVILFDFGGVLAEEGFRNGLGVIAGNNGLDQEFFVKTGFDLIHKVGYLLGQAEESDYWRALRRETGIAGADEELRRVILSHFKMRPWMLKLIEKLKQGHIRIGILSDQTNWLDELDKKYDIFGRFDFVFNSYYLGKSKRDPTLFDDVLGLMGVRAHEALFVDDYPGNIERAKVRGLHTVLYEDRAGLFRELALFCPFLKSEMNNR